MENQLNKIGIVKNLTTNNSLIKTLSDCKDDSVDMTIEMQKANALINKIAGVDEWRRLPVFDSKVLDLGYTIENLYTNFLEGITNSVYHGNARISYIIAIELLYKTIVREKNLDKDEESFETLCKRLLKPRYDNADKAHDWKHVLEVLGDARAINIALDLKISEKEIIYASLAHDIFSYTDREVHHTKAGEWVSKGEDYHAMLLNRRLHRTDRVARAVAEHRGSYKGEFYSLLSELISSADRGSPDLSRTIKRIWQCANDSNLTFQMDIHGIPDIEVADSKLPIICENMKKEGWSDEEIKTFAHLIEKYSIAGYARYSRLYKEFYKESLLDMWIEIEKIAKNPLLIKQYLF